MTLLSEYEMAVKNCNFEIIKRYTKEKDDKCKELWNGRSIVWCINRYRYNEQDQLMFSQLMQLRLSINTTNKYGQTLLHVAIEENNQLLFEDLIKYKADINISDHLGLTPIFYAVISRNLQMVKTLIILDVKLDVLDYDGWNPFMYLLIKTTPYTDTLQNEYDIGILLLKNTFFSDEIIVKIKTLCKQLNRMDLFKLIKQYRLLES